MLLLLKMEWTLKVAVLDASYQYKIFRNVGKETLCLAMKMHLCISDIFRNLCSPLDLLLALILLLSQYFPLTFHCCWRRSGGHFTLSQYFPFAFSLNLNTFC